MVKECKKEVLRRPKRKALSLKERKRGFATVESFSKRRPFKRLNVV
jgi:hypothetical protein